MNTETANPAETVMHTEELGSTGEVTVMIVHEGAPEQALEAGPAGSDARPEEGFAADVNLAWPAELQSPDLIAYLDDLAAQEGAQALDTLGLPSVTFARPAKTAAASPATGPESHTTAATEHELRIQ